MAIVTAPRGKAKQPAADKARAAPARAPAIPRSELVEEHPYALAALDAECEAIRCAADGGQEATLNSAALKIGHYVGGGVIRYETALARLIAAGMQMHSHNPADPWKPEIITAKVDRALRDGMAEPKGVPDASSEPLRFDPATLAAKSKPNGEDESAPNSLVRPVKLADLMKMQFPAIKYVVPGYVAEGLTVLAGAPKIGKSWMALNLAVAVAGGTQALGSIQCSQADVLYIALEDNPRRMQKRAQILQCPIPDALEVVFDWPAIGSGCENKIREWAARSRNPGMVVIDVFNRVRPPKKGSAQQYDVDYQDMAPLQKLAGELGLAIMIVHHTRKMTAEDPFDTVSGTRGITGAADTILVLCKLPDAILPTLYGRGRDIEEIEKAVQFNNAFGTWLLDGPPAFVAKTKERTDIIRTLRDAGGVMSTGEIAEALGKETSNISHQLTSLLEEGKVVKAGYGKWTLS
ncbi:MAG: AAA family ATPase [Erythrobacter sp.]|nr:AAA family ATPase [Erythrobacter sp.]